MFCFLSVFFQESNAAVTRHSFPFLRMRIHQHLKEYEIVFIPSSQPSLHKKSSFPLRISSVNVTKKFLADLVTFTEEILFLKLHFLCSALKDFLPVNLHSVFSKKIISCQLVSLSLCYIHGQVATYTGCHLNRILSLMKTWFWKLWWNFSSALRILVLLFE